MIIIIHLLSRKPIETDNSFCINMNTDEVPSVIGLPILKSLLRLYTGFSDPYCMLGIQPASLPASPRASEDEGRKHGFRLSFKRRDGRQHRDSLGRLPARYIRATSVKPHTLSPKWNETFKL